MPELSLVRLTRMLLFCLALLPMSVSAEETPAAPPLPAGMKLTAPEISPELTGTLRALHERLSRDLQPTDNAVIWLVHVYGDEAFDAELHDVNLEMLGISEMSPASPLFVPISVFVQSLDDVTPGEVPLQSALIEEQLVRKADVLWVPEDSPRLAGYLAANEQALNTLAVAAGRPRYYAPLLAPEIPSRLMSASLVVERRLPFLARMLAARALLNAGQGNMSAAINDLLTCHKLATLLANGSPFDVSVAKAQVIDSIAFHAERALLESGRLNAEQLAEFARLYAALPPFPPAAQSVDIGERAIVHQEIELLTSDKDSQLGFFEDPKHAPGDITQVPSLSLVKWEAALQRANEIQDQIVAAMSTQDRAVQAGLFEQLDQQYADWDASADLKTEKFSSEVADHLAAISAWVGENLAMSLRPNYRQRCYSEHRVSVRRNMITLGIALEAAQRKHGSFPESLDQLVPEFLPEIPADACTAGPFHYTRLAPDQARLVSWGTNQQDDAGKDYNDDFELKLH